MDIDQLTLGQAKQLMALLSEGAAPTPTTPPVSLGDVVRVESVTYAHEGVVAAITSDYIELKPAVRNTDMVRLHRHLAGVVNDSQTENEECPFGVKVACQAITCILPMVTPNDGFVTNKAV